MARVFKKRPLNGPKTYKAWKEWQEGDYVVGKFVATSIDKFKKTNWHLELIEYKFKDGTKLPENKVLGLNSTALLDKVMEGVTIGEVLQIDYDGTETLTSGPYEGNESHSMIISILEEEELDTDGL